jgi:flagellar basal-body rod protein FlgB
MVSGLFGSVVRDLEQGLGYATRRHEVLTQNIANVETPGYKARDLVFASELRASLAAEPDAEGARRARSLEATLPDAASAPRVVLAHDAPPALNGNDVNLDRQMSRLAENTLFHQTLVQLLASQFNTLKQAVSGRS